MDGTGHGDDGAVWGGEFMLFSPASYERRYHLEYVPMPGGDRAVLEPFRMALSHLARALGPEEALRRMGPAAGEERCAEMLQVMDRPRFSPPTSSCGRLFDAMAALLGVRQSVTYQGQAPRELEALCAQGEEGSYPFDYDGESILVGPLLRAVCGDLDRGLAPGRIAARFHNTIAEIIGATCLRMREETGLQKVALAGGVMQNRTLVEAAAEGLERAGFEVVLCRRVPANDGGVCLGQVSCALARSDG